MVCLTFDDGDMGVYEHAFPVLAGIPATAYVVTDWVGLPGRMGLKQLHELQAAGWAVGSHSADHWDLRTLDRQEQMDNLLRARVLLEGWGFWAGGHVAYPRGKLNDDTLTAMQELGMDSGRTIVPGATDVPPDDKYRIPSYIFRAGNVPLRFAEATEAASNNGSAVVLCMHDVVAEKPKDYQVSAKQLEALVGWFDAQGAEFGTIEDLVGGASA